MLIETKSNKTYLRKRHLILEISTVFLKILYYLPLEELRDLKDVESWDMIHDDDGDDFHLKEQCLYEFHSHENHHHHHHETYPNSQHPLGPLTLQAVNNRES